MVYLPEGEGEDLTRRAAGRGIRRSSRSGHRAAGVAATAGLARRARSRGPRTADVLHVPLAGVDLLVRRKPGVPSVTLGYYVPRTRPRSPRRAGLGALAIRSAVRGAGTLDAAALAYATEGLGGTLSASASLDWTG